MKSSFWHGQFRQDFGGKLFSEIPVKMCLLRAVTGIPKNWKVLLRMLFFVFVFYFISSPLNVMSD